MVNQNQQLEDYKGPPFLFLFQKELILLDFSCNAILHKHV